jgi:hypothetical protein
MVGREPLDKVEIRCDVPADTLIEERDTITGNIHCTHSIDVFFGYIRGYFLSWILREATL